MTGESPLEIRRATCRAMFVFDVGREIDLAAVRRALPGQLREREEACRPRAICVDSPPVRLEIETSAATADGFAVERVVSVAVYDFGAVALTYAVPVAGGLDRLQAASAALTGDARLAAAARRDVAALLATIAAAVADPALDEVSEEYLVFEVSDFAASVRLSNLPESSGRDLARVLRAETPDPSDQEIAHALASPIARTPGDLVLLDWNAALVFDTAPGEVREVLELANVQLLEMRFLDRRLDESLHRGYDVVSSKRFWRPVFLPDALRDSMRRIAQRQVDAAILHERVANALKLVGDQYLARVYRRAAQRFELEAWNSANGRKLDTLESIYEKIHDRASIARAEMLEWIVILLILASTVIPFLVPYAK